MDKNPTPIRALLNLSAVNFALSAVVAAISKAIGVLGAKSSEYLPTIVGVSLHWMEYALLTASIAVFVATEVVMLVKYFRGLPQSGERPHD